MLEVITQEQYDALSEEEQALYELDKKTLGSYVKKASDDATKHSYMAAKNTDLGAASKASKRIRGIMKATDKLAEEVAAAASLKPGSKIAAMTNILSAMHGMKKEDLTKWYDQAMALIGKEADSLPAGANADANQASVDMKTGKGPKTRDAMPKLDVREDVEEMFAGEELSEEFISKASTLFEAAVNARLTVELARLEEEANEIIESEIAKAVESLENSLDSYLNYAVEKWMEENQVAIESSLRNELAEEFISGLKGLFAEHYIDVPEDKVDVMEALAAKVEALEETVNDLMEENTDLKGMLSEALKNKAIEEVAEGLTVMQTEKFYALAEGVSFDGDIDEFKEKLEVVKENFFKVSRKPAETNLEEETFEGETLNESMVSRDPTVNRYVQAISRTVKR